MNLLYVFMAWYQIKHRHNLSVCKHGSYYQRYFRPSNIEIVTLDDYDYRKVRKRADYAQYITKYLNLSIYLMCRKSVHHHTFQIN